MAEELGPSRKAPRPTWHELADGGGGFAEGITNIATSSAKPVITILLVGGLLLLPFTLLGGAIVLVCAVVLTALRGAWYILFDR